MQVGKKTLKNPKIPHITAIVSLYNLKNPQPINNNKPTTTTHYQNEKTNQTNNSDLLILNF